MKLADDKHLTPIGIALKRRVQSIAAFWRGFWTALKADHRD